MYISYAHILSVLEHPRGMMRTLTDLEPCRDEAGEPICRMGNSALVAKVRIAGRVCKLRCYLRPKRNLAAIYRREFLPAEMFVPLEDGSGSWHDVVVEPWIEGESLQCALVRAASAGDREALRRLAAAFDRFAVWLLAQEWAHGDLKPDNLIVEPDGRISAIDFDAMYRPDEPGMVCDECGTRAYQHPSRTMEVFDASVDDYPVAFISTALHALALDPSLWSHCEGGDVLLMDPVEAVAARSAVLEQVERLFARTGDAVRCRVARMLRSRYCRLPELYRILEYGVNGAREAVGTLRLEGEGGLWGYRDDEGFVIPPLYDCAFEFGDGRALVRMCGFIHFIDRRGAVRIDCSDCDAVRPFRGGVAEIVRGGRRVTVDPDGAEIVF